MSGAVQWGVFAAAVPGLAAEVQARLAAHPHHVLATLRADGSPRVNGTNVYVTDGRMWFGTMTGAVRAADMRRDPRVAIHSAPLDDKLPAGSGDARVSGTVRALAPEDGRALLVAVAGEEAGAADGEFFELLVDSVSLVEVHGQSVVVRSWTPDGGEQVRLRS